MAIQSDQEFAPTQIARAVFPTAFRGYDQDAVRRYLSRLASALEHQQEYAGLGELEARTPAHERVDELETEVEDLRQEIRDLELELVQRSVSGESESSAEPVADAVPFDEHRAIELLGKETARVLESARSAAADILKRAETQAASLKSQAKSELAEARRRSDSILAEAQTETEELTARLTTEAEAEAERISNEAKEHREAVLEESSKILSEAETLAESEQAGAEERAKQVVADAETLRQQVVSELVAERREAQLDMERIKAARDRLAMSLAVARSELDEVADALVDASVSQDERPPSVPVPVGGRSHREEVAGLIDQLESAAAESEPETKPDSQGDDSDPVSDSDTIPDSDLNLDPASDPDTDTDTDAVSAESEPTTDAPLSKDNKPADGAPAKKGDGADVKAADKNPSAKKQTKAASGNPLSGNPASGKKNNRSTAGRKGATPVAEDVAVSDDGGLKIGGTSDQSPNDEPANNSAGSAGKKPEDRSGKESAGTAAGSTGDHNGAATRATDGVRASVKQKKNGRSRKNQQKAGRSGASSKTGATNKTGSPQTDKDDDELVSVIDAALSQDETTGSRAKSDAKDRSSGKPTEGNDDDLVNVLGQTDQSLDLDDAELNKLPADGEALSLVEGFTTIDVGDIDLRSDKDDDRSTGDDGGGGADGDANPELVHSVVVNEPQIPEDVITTVASRTATSGSERTQGDLLIEQPFTGRLPKEFSARDLALTRSGPNFRRQLRRALNDDQSDVLDRLRAGRGAITVDELPTFNDQIERYHAPLRRGLAEIAQAGAKVGGQADLSHAALDNLVRQLAKYIVDRVRVPTIQVVDEDTDGDRERILEPIRALYRDFRNVGLPDLSEDALYEAFAIGLYDSIEPSAPVSWVLDPRSDPDPVCDINSRREDVVKGATFPSGHARPLSLPGCRCLVTLADY